MKLPALVAALVCAVAMSAGAQSPQERRVSLHARDIALREALDRVALLGGVKLSYSGDNLPLDRRVTISRDSVPVLEVLRDLVRPFAVDPVVISTELVVLAPRREVAVDTAARAIAVLDRVVVTGSVLGASERPLPIALDVVKGRDIERRDEGTLSKVFSGAVPGVWMWEQTPTTMLARYASIRGASSFGLSFPKIYIDGIEVANPLLLTQITPELVERVEVIRGPQGAALYGSDAISGVVNIVSRHEGAGPDGANTFVRSAIGTSATRFGAGSGVQEHALTVRAGSNLRSAGLTVGGSTSGQYVPHAYSREIRSVGDARLIGASASMTGTARFFGKNAGVPVNPALAALDAGSIRTDGDPQRLRTYAMGTTVTLVPTEAWTYSVTAGLDGYRLSNVASDQGPVPSVVDTALRAASGSATRGTMRASAVTHIGSPDRVGATVTFGAEQSFLWDRTAPDAIFGTSGPSGASRDASGMTANGGILTQTTIAVRDAAFVSAGLRSETIGHAGGRTQHALLPMIGAAFVQDFEALAVKWRAAYGKGIRGSHASMRLGMREPRRTIANASLAPEQQAGIEAGVDVRLARILGIHVTRFDQTVSGLIQAVTVENPTGSNSGPSKSSWYQLQNVGEISNRGWETQASLALGPLSMDAAASFVDSRVQRVARNYTGDMQKGDRMLAVPSRTLSGTVSWVQRKYQLSATVSRASDWINYDRLRIAQALVSDSVYADDLTGRALRDYWSAYPGSTRVRANFSRSVWRGLVLNVTGENLLHNQRGEPDTITIVPGRTISVGVKARF